MHIKSILAAGAAVIALAASSAASAAVIIEQGNIAGNLDTVLLDGADTGLDKTILGESNEGWTVVVTGLENIKPSNHGGSQVWVEGSDGGLRYLDVATPDATFTRAELNINYLKTADFNITLWGYDANGNAFTQYVDKNLLAYPPGAPEFDDISKNTFFNFMATGGDVFTHVSFTTTEDVAVGQIRLGAVTGVVPEPASWALMITGFGGVGAMMRRRRVALAA